jgi:hypothetical protein
LSSFTSCLMLYSASFFAFYAVASALWSALRSRLP